MYKTQFNSAQWMNYLIHISFMSIIKKNSNMILYDDSFDLI